jgi:glycine/D-amino acid oxidase-like deaminating enzyme
MQQQYDAIVIGSGIGGLSTAALLAKAYNKKYWSSKNIGQ